MSALGGIIHANQAYVDPELLLGMSRSMILWGTVRREAYLNRGVGVFHNGTRAAERSSQGQPLTLRRNEKNYTLVLDGTVTGLKNVSSAPSPDDFLSSAEFVLEAYLTFGAEFVGSLEGAFSLAICDEERGEVLLARDRQGSHPLFYTVEGEELVFASEIKALLRCFSDAVGIRAEALRSHVTAPCGALRGEDLYDGVHSLPPGHCGVFSRMGLTLFPYEEISYSSEPRRPAQASESIGSVFYCPDRDTLRQNLIEALFAFDYPQFDPWVPGLLRRLEQLSPEQRQRPLRIEDPTPCMNLNYAWERAERLSALRSVQIDSVIPLECSPPPREMKRMDRLLAELLKEVDPSLLCRLFGADWQVAVEKEKNPEKRIRTRGLLYQSALWFENYPIRLL